MSNPSLRTGLIGAGASLAMYGEALARLAELNVVGVADPSEAARAKAREVLGRVPLYDSAEALIAGEDLDVVLVASPVFCHSDHVRAATARGLHVLVEKPMARTPAEAAAMVAAAHRAGVVLGVAFNRRHLPPLWTATQMVRAGELGEVFSTECIWTSCTPFYGGWRDDRRALGGVFQDHGAHSIDLARVWLGEVESVSARGLRIRPDTTPGREVEDGLTALAAHEGGGTSLHVHSRRSHRPVSEFYRIYGTKGTLELEYTGDWAYLAPDPWDMRLYRDGKPAPEHLVARRPHNELVGAMGDGHYAFFAELRDFARAARQCDETRCPSGEDGLAVTRAIAAAFLSAADGRTVSLGEADAFDEAAFDRLIERCTVG